jgi:hypothetical protein
VHKLDTTLAPFTVRNVDEAIRASKNSSAVGPDGLTAIHLKHLGHYALRYRTELFNLSICYAEIPAIWKSAIIVPILKPGKSPDQNLSYRPISLLSPAAKILERLLYPEIRPALPIAKFQHDYTSFHSTVTALLPFVTRVAVGFNDVKPACRSALLALDISKVFNSLDHTVLIEDSD